MANIVYFYRNLRGDAVVENYLWYVAERQNQSWQRIRTALEKLVTYGINRQASRNYTRLKHVEGLELWEVKVPGSPAYRILFAPVPNESAFVVLNVVLKSDMDKTSRKLIDDALDRFDHWFGSQPAATLQERTSLEHPNAHNTE